LSGLYGKVPIKVKTGGGSQNRAKDVEEVYQSLPL
jgi:hypothetical protein